MKNIYILFIICANFCALAQNEMIQKFNEAINDSDIYSLHKYFKHDIVFNDFKFYFEKKKMYNVSFVEKSNESKNGRSFKVWELVDNSSHSKVADFNVFKEDNNEKGNIKVIGLKKDNVNNTKKLFLDKLIDVPYIINDSMKLPELDSLTKNIERLFTADKLNFIKTYYSLEFTAQYIGDNWAMRESLKQNDISNIQYQSSFFDKHINRGAITFLLTFADNSIETGVYYFKMKNNKLCYFYTDSDFNLERFLE